MKIWIGKGDLPNIMAHKYHHQEEQGCGFFYLGLIAVGTKYQRQRPTQTSSSVEWNTLSWLQSTCSWLFGVINHVVSFNELFFSDTSTDSILQPRTPNGDGESFCLSTFVTSVHICVSYDSFFPSLILSVALNI